MSMSEDCRDIERESHSIIAALNCAYDRGYMTAGDINFIKNTWADILNIAVKNIQIELNEDIESKWFNVSECLPLIDAKVAVYFEETIPHRFVKGQKICFSGRFDGFRWYVDVIEDGIGVFEGANIMEFKIIKWRYETKL